MRNSSGENGITLGHFFITALPLTLLVGRIVDPKIIVDDKTVYLTMIALIPWVSPMLKTIEIPGGGKIEFNNLKVAASKAGLLDDSEITPGFTEQVVSGLPALPGKTRSATRIGLSLTEAISNLAAKYNIDTKSDLTETIDELGNILPAIESKKIVLKMMVKAIDKMLEGSSINRGHANIVQSVTPKLIAMLNQLAQHQESSA